MKYCITYIVNGAIVASRKRKLVPRKGETVQLLEELYSVVEVIWDEDTDEQNPRVTITLLEALPNYT